MSADGIPITFAGGTGGLNASGADRIDFTVWGTNVAYRLYDWNRLRSSSGNGWTEHLEEIPDARQEGYRRQIGAIGAFFNGDKHPLPDFAQALRVGHEKTILARRRCATKFSLCLFAWS